MVLIYGFNWSLSQIQIIPIFLIIILVNTILSFWQTKSHPLIFPDPDQAEQGEEGAHGGPGYHVLGVMLVVCDPATGHYQGIHQSQDLGRQEWIN